MKISHILQESPQQCPECGGPAFGDLILAEKKDACYSKVRSRYKVWPSAYASGALVQCRKKGADNWGNKSKNEGVEEGVKIVDQDSDLDQQVYTLNVDGNKVSFTYWDYENNFQSPDIKDIFQQAQEQLGKKLSLEQVKAVARAVFRTFEQGVAEGSLNEFAVSGDGGDGDDSLFNYAKMWYNGDLKTQRQVEKALQRQGLDIGENEDENGGAYISDISGDYYESWTAEDLEQGVAEGSESSPVADAIFRRLQMQKPDLFARHGLEAVADAVYAVADSVGTVDEIGSSDVSGWIRKVEQMLNNTNENYNAEYDDEAGMADNNLETLSRAVAGIDELIQSGDNLPEWCQEKIAVAKSMLVSVWDYMYSEEASDEVDPEIDAMYEAMDQLAEEIAAKEKISVDQVWESFESLSDHMLYETAAWRRKEGKSKTGGLNRKGVASYRRENPGSKLQMAVTTKPSKLKPGSKAAKRRKSFCARMSGVKGPMKKPNGKPTRKALALRKWNC